MRLTKQLSCLTMLMLIGGCSPEPEVEPDLVSGELRVEHSLFGQRTPAHPLDPDGAAVEVGLKFRASAPGQVTGLRFYKGGPANGGTHTGHLWTASGQLLGTVTFSNEGTSGWQTARFGAPIRISPNTVYVASYFAPLGRYAGDNGFFASRGHARGSLYGLKNGEAGGNGVYRYGPSPGFPTSTWESSNYYVDVLFLRDEPDAGAQPSPADAGTPPSTPDAGAPPPTPDAGTRPDAGTPGACPSAVPNTPGGPDPWGGCWPSEANTGVPSGTVLTPYTGPCTITQNDTVIDRKTVNCRLEIRAKNVVITNSKINGSVWIDDPGPAYSFTITDSEIDAGSTQGNINDCASAIGKSHFVATRVHTYGGIRGIWCEYDCTVQDSWVHGQARDPTGRAHESGIRMGDGSILRHNSIRCDAPEVPPDAGCSADLTGYGDFAPIRNNTIERNLFLATTGGACAYGGSSGDDGAKPYGNQAANIAFIDNVFQRSSSYQSSGKCGYYFPITDFDITRPGNRWVGNRWDNGAVLPPAN
ncbi:MAG: DUF4082 domain-containing protein [Archangiaceae bacterium]|nr:DUF4082 domain-containing protein [Archangiaceae bacterium]